MNKNTLVVSTCVMNIIANECLEELKEKVTNHFPPLLLSDDYMDINKDTGKKIVHSLIMRDSDDVKNCAEQLNNFAKEHTGFFIAIPGDYFMVQDVVACKNGEFLFEKLSYFSK